MQAFATKPIYDYQIKVHNKLNAGLQLAFNHFLMDFEYQRVFLLSFE